MCVIIHAPAGVKFPVEELAAAWRANDDGAGYSITDPATLKVKAVKGIMTLKSLEEKVAKLDLEGTHLTVHLRIKTSGWTDKNNTHPWLITSTDTKETMCAVMHNGIMQCVKDEKGISDTGVWTRDFVLPLFNANVLHMKEVRTLLAEQIGSWNKVVIHQEFHEPAILNAKSGSWVNGVWYSNRNFVNYGTGRTWGYTTCSTDPSWNEVDDEDFKKWRNSYREGKVDSSGVSITTLNDAEKTAEAVQDVLSKEWGEGSPMDVLADFISNPEGFTIEKLQELERMLTLPVTSFGSMACDLPLHIYRQKVETMLEELILEEALNEQDEEDEAGWAEAKKENEKKIREQRKAKNGNT